MSEKGQEMELGLIMAVDYPEHQTSTRNVLLHVDDDEVQRRLSRALFENWGYTVFGASSGGAACMLFGKQHIDIVVIDYRMPGMDGVETASVIREVYPKIPIVLYTSEIELPPHALLCVSRLVRKAGDPESLREALLALAPNQHGGAYGI
jgi:CheY-like chemotaxis protein